MFSTFPDPPDVPVSMLSFLLDAQDWPANPAPFKYTNILIHLLCGLAFCWLSFLLSQLLQLSRAASAQIALFVMGIWLVHPLNVSTTLYVVQRMTQLMTLFAGLSLIFICWVGELLSIIQEGIAISRTLLVSFRTAIGFEQGKWCITVVAYRHYRVIVFQGSY